MYTDSRTSTHMYTTDGPAHTFTDKQILHHLLSIGKEALGICVKRFSSISLHSYGEGREGEEEKVRGKEGEEVRVGRGKGREREGEERGRGGEGEGRGRGGKRGGGE